MEEWAGRQCFERLLGLVMVGVRYLDFGREREEEDLQAALVAWRGQGMVRFLGGEAVARHALTRGKSSLG